MHFLADSGSELPRCLLSLCAPGQLPAVTSPGRLETGATPTNKRSIYNKHKGVENKQSHILLLTFLHQSLRGIKINLEVSSLVSGLLNECLSGGRNIHKDQYSVSAIDVWLCYAFIRITAQVSKYTQEPRHQIPSLGPVRCGDQSAQHFRRSSLSLSLRSPLNFTLLLIFLLVPCLRCLPSQPRVI